MLLEGQEEIFRPGWENFSLTTKKLWQTPQLWRIGLIFYSTGTQVSKKRRISPFSWTRTSRLPIGGWGI